MGAFRRRLAGVATTVLTLSVLGFGAETAYATAGALTCSPQDPGYLGECPPYNDISCDADCYLIFGTFGDCSPGCCLCAYH